MKPIKSQPIFHILLMSLILVGLAWVAFKPLIFTNSDVGLRFIQIRNLIDQEWQTFAIPYTTDIDPDFEFVPYYYAYSLLNGRIYFNISPFYPLIASFLYTALGILGLAISPVIGSALTAWGVYRLANQIQLRYPLLITWASIFATPMIFYTTQVWDHTLGVGLIVLGISFALQGVQEDYKRGVLIGGILLGLAMGQRPELYLFVIVFGFAWLLFFWQKRPFLIPLLGGGLLGIVPLWLLQAKWFGHPLGMATATNLLGYGRPESFPIILDGYPRAVVMGNFLFHIESRDPLTFTAALTVLIGILLFVFAFRNPPYQKKSIILTATILTTIGYLLWGIVTLENMITGFISTFPLIGIALAFVEEKEKSKKHTGYKFIFTVAIIYLIGMVLFWPAFGARLWGARYLLTAYPLMLLLAFYALDSYHQRLPTALKPTVQAIFVALLIISFSLQMMGLRFNYQAINTLAQEKTLITEQSVDVVLTNHPFWPGLMGGVDDKLFFYTSTTQKLESILPALAENNVHHVAIISLASEPLIMPEQLGNLSITQTSDNVYLLQIDE